jgi:hypothetical protein
MVEDPLLVGEKRNVYVNHEDVRMDSISRNHGFLAVGVLLGDSDLVEIASLCKMEAHQVSEGGFLATLLAVGRVTLTSRNKSWPARYFCAPAKDAVLSSDLQNAVLVEGNIQSFVTKLTAMERCLGFQRSFRHEYECAFRKALDVEEDSSSLVALLTATSWAVFTVCSDQTSYRIRALDWCNLFERLKLAQYMLRERELLLQGRMMTLERIAFDELDDAGDVEQETEGFQ